MCSSLAVANLYSGYVNSHHHCRPATCTCFGMGCPGFSRKRRQAHTRAPSTTMKIPRVHQEISMKRSCVAFPKSDFGLTVVMGESHRDQPHEERTTAMATRSRTVGTRKGRRARRMGSFT